MFTANRFTTRKLTASIASVAVIAAVGAGCGASKPQATQRLGSASPTTGVAAAEMPATSAPARLVAGLHSNALDFAVNDAAASTGTVNAFATPADSAGRSGAPRAGQAVSTLIRALITGDADTAWSMLGSAEREKLGYKQRLTDESSAAGWKSFQLAGTSGDASTGGRVTVEITQTPSVSDINGVSAPSATVTFPVVKEGALYTVVWSRRSVTQNYPERSATADGQVLDTVATWARARQECTTAPTTTPASGSTGPDHEYTGGLLGVVGLATALCHTTGRPVLGGVGDLDSLDEPQPVIDGFGGSALLWARVVPITAPVAMNVVVAPDGAGWTVVAIARPSLATS